MKTFLLCLAASAFVTSVSAQTSKGDAKQDLIGTWKGHLVQSDGSPQGEIMLAITEDKITASNPRGGQMMGAGTYRVSSSSAKKRRIDATGTAGQFQGKRYEGIYSIEGKTLKWCSANDNPNSKRPNDLKTNTQAGQFLMVLEKQ